MELYNNVIHFLANPWVSLIGYVIGVISGLIAIYQTISSLNKGKEIARLVSCNSTLVIENNQLKTVVNNQVSQGEKSQYFQSNNGPVNIDVR